MIRMSQNKIYLLIFYTKIQCGANFGKRIPAFNLGNLPSIDLHYTSVWHLQQKRHRMDTLCIVNFVDAQMAQYAHSPGYDAHDNLIGDLYMLQNWCKHAALLYSLHLTKRTLINKKFPDIKFVELGTSIRERWRASIPVEKKNVIISHQETKSGLMTSCRSIWHKRQHLNLLLCLLQLS